MDSFWKGAFIEKHVTAVRFIPLDQMDEKDIPDTKNWSKEDKKKFYRKNTLVGYFHVTFDMHEKNKGTDKRPKYHGGQKEYYYPADQSDRLDFEQNRIDDKDFYRW
jgi:hypothetical protein